eukprot:GILI01030691.1.p1 GENE.GILI01030691.1~~GILI01030691.1.p1  ORF type:complete len:348 (-),score=18.76 GILI01030691.1:562-1566(-)
MLAAVAYNPETLQSVTSFSNRLNLVANIISFNTTGVAYGLHCTAKFPLNPVFLITENIIYHVANDGGNVTAIFIDFPLTGIDRFLTKLDIQSNEARRIWSFVQLTVQPTYISFINNFHSHFAETINRITFNFSAAVENYLDVKNNVFVTTFDSWNPMSSYGNPLLILWTPLVRNVTRIDVMHNDFYASSYTKSPIQFTGTTNLFANSVLNLQDNFFTTNERTASSISMSSFASAEPRTIDQGTVYVCSNTWPAIFVAATATPTAQTANPTTRTATAPIDSVTLLVDSADSPRNVSQSGGSCPVVVTTRQPSLSRLPSVFASVFVLALAIFGSLL